MKKSKSILFLLFLFNIIFLSSNISILNYSNNRNISISMINLPDNNPNKNWNNGSSNSPDIVIDNNNEIHMVWSDNTEGIWGDDYEIMYEKIEDQSSGKNTRIISDGYQGGYFNWGNSSAPEIEIDHNGKFHVVWMDNSEGIWTNGPYDYEIMYASSEDGILWSNATVISDGFNGIYWNNDGSLSPDIAIDSNNKIHVVWNDWTEGPWGTDSEIMYASSSDGVTWSNITITSDGFNGTYWNNGLSSQPSIVIDNSDMIHIVWDDDTHGIWGDDYEIMYASSEDGILWSNATVISDDETYWNNGNSINPAITTDVNENIHVVWQDNTEGVWDTDSKIMYCSFIQSIGWSNATVISDGYGGYYWNNGTSEYPSIAIDEYNIIHVVWSDDTDGIWGNDKEIMYTSSLNGVTWLNATVISEEFNSVYWNNGDSKNPSIAIDDSNMIHVVWSDDTDGKWGNDKEIMYTSSLEGIIWSNISILSDQLVSINTQAIYELYFIFNLIISLILLGCIFILSLLKKLSRKNNKSIYYTEILDISSILISSTLAIPQIYQINYNSSIIFDKTPIDLFIFLFPYIILLLSIIIILISIISLVISLDEYYSYIRRKTNQYKKHPKLNFDDIFKNKNREKIIKLILSEPGIHHNDLRRRCDLYPNQINWHLNILLEYGIIKKDKINNYTIFYPNIQEVSSKIITKKLIKSKTTLDILNLIEEQPGIKPSSLGRDLELKKTTISYHINKLKRKNIIKTIREGRELKLFTLENCSKNEPQMFLYD